MTRLYHGSNDLLAVGTVLRGRGASYEADWHQTGFYGVLERYRPDDAIPHAEAVFAVDDPDVIDVAGGGTEWIFELEAEGPVSRHDLNWSSEISCLLSDGHAEDSEAVAAAARNYWAGLPHPNESVWEYLVREATIVRVGSFEDFEIETASRSFQLR